MTHILNRYFKHSTYDIIQHRDNTAFCFCGQNIVIWGGYTWRKWRVLDQMIQFISTSVTIKINKPIQSKCEWGFDSCVEMEETIKKYKLRGCTPWRVRNDLLKENVQWPISKENTSILLETVGKIVTRTSRRQVYRITVTWVRTVVLSVRLLTCFTC